MNGKTIIFTLFSVLIAVVVFSSLLPVFGAVIDNSGDEITKTNDGTGHTFREMAPGDVFKCQSTYTNGTVTDTWTLNDNPVLNFEQFSYVWDWGLISDAYYLIVFASDNASASEGHSITASGGTSTYQVSATEDNPSVTYTWTMNNDKTISYQSVIGETTTTSTINSKWAYVACSIEDGAYMSAQDTTMAYYAGYDSKDVILAGNYTTGDFDTGYYYGKDGVLTVVNDSYTGAVNFSQSRSAGTTDIYDTLVTVSITDGVDTEEFSPYRALVPYEVEGHASGGTMYSIMSLLPLVLAIGLIIGAVALIFRRS